MRVLYDSLFLSCLFGCRPSVLPLNDPSLYGGDVDRSLVPPISQIQFQVCTSNPHTQTRCRFTRPATEPSINSLLFPRNPTFSLRSFIIRHSVIQCPVSHYFRRPQLWRRYFPPLFSDGRHLQQKHTGSPPSPIRRTSSRRRQSER